MKNYILVKKITSEILARVNREKPRAKIWRIIRKFQSNINYTRITLDKTWMSNFLYALAPLRNWIPLDDCIEPMRKARCNHLQWRSFCMPLLIKRIQHLD